MFRIILVVIALWMLYKLVFHLIIPVYRSTKIMRAKIREMQQQMQNQMNQQGGESQYSNKTQYGNTKPEGKKGDYIEFEEVK